VIEVAVVLVTGAAGTLGNALVSRLAGHRHQVLRVLLHRRSADFPPGYT
jgi:nucleoside-diphosphate-sugar epimerase